MGWATRKRNALKKISGSLNSTYWGSLATCFTDYGDMVGSLIRRWATHKICLNRHLNKTCSFLGLLKLTRNYLGWNHRGIHWAQEHWHLSQELGKLRPKKIWSRANGRGAGLLALVFKFSGLRSPAIFWPGGTGFLFSFFLFFYSNLNWSGCCLQLRF